MIQRIQNPVIYGLVSTFNKYEPMKIIEFFTVQTEHIVDVRKGQKSSGFDKYPYEEMEQQSLSVFVQEEKQSM